MKKIFLLIGIILGALASAESTKTDDREVLLPEVQQILTLKPVSKEELDNTINAGIYGFDVQEDVDFVEKGSEDLYQYLKIKRQNLLNGEKTFEKINPFKPLESILINIKPICIGSMSLERDKSQERYFECLKNKRAEYEKMFRDYELYLSRYKKLQTLELGTEIEYLYLWKRFDLILRLSGLRTAQAFYLMDDGLQDNALKILTEEKNFFIKLGKNQKYAHQLYNGGFAYNMLGLQRIFAIFLNFNMIKPNENDTDIQVFLEQIDSDFHPINLSWAYRFTKSDILFFYYFNQKPEPHYIWFRIFGDIDNLELINEIYKFNEQCFKPTSEMTFDEFSALSNEDVENHAKNCYQLSDNSNNGNKEMYVFFKLFLNFDKTTYLRVFEDQKILQEKYKIFLDRHKEGD